LQELRLSESDVATTEVFADDREYVEAADALKQSARFF
jgi:hypothetical protein